MPRTLALILLVGFAVRLPLVILVAPHPERFIRFDAVGYDRLGQNLASGNGFSRAEVEPFSADNLRTPGYPALLALCYWLFGHRPHLVLFIQLLLSIVTIIVTYRIGELVGGTAVGLWAAALFSLSMVSVLYTVLLWSDTLFALVLSLSIWAALRTFSSLRFEWAALTGLLLGLATLVHPRSLFLPLLIGPVLFSVSVKRNSLKRAVLSTLLLVVLFSLPVTAWVGRNYSVFGVANMTSVTGINMLFYWAALTEASITKEEQQQIAQRYRAEVNAQSDRPLNEAELATAAFRLGVRKIQDAPLAFMKSYLAGVAKVFVPSTTSLSPALMGRVEDVDHYRLFVVDVSEGALNALRSASGPVWLIIGLNTVYLASVYLLCLLALSGNGRTMSWLFLAGIIVYLALVAGISGAPRFRLAAMPYLCILAAQGADSLGLLVARRGWFGRETGDKETF